VLERDEIYQRVWGYAMIHGDRSVDVFVRKLRSKLHRRSPGWEYIHTHFGIGYRFDAQPLQPEAGEVPTATRGVPAEGPIPDPGADAPAISEDATGAPEADAIKPTGA
jgi:DNA-binding winged helix-turn-helix (wHTH) protein